MCQCSNIYGLDCVSEWKSWKKSVLRCWWSSINNSNANRYLQSRMYFVWSVFDYAINHRLFGVLYLSACTGESWRVSGLTRSWIDVRFHQFGWRSSPWLIIFRSYLVLLIKTVCADGEKRIALPKYTTLFVCFIIKVVCDVSTTARQKI